MATQRCLALARALLFNNPCSNSTGDASRAASLDAALEEGLARLRGLLTSADNSPPESGASCSTNALCAVAAEVASEESVRWRYARACVALLDAFVESASSGDGGVEDACAMLSTEDTRALRHVVELVVCLGVLPNLSQGVGVPVDRRTNRGATLAIRASETDVPPSADARAERLSLCVESLVNVCTRPSLRALLMSSSVGDVVAGLLQLAHEPMSGSAGEGVGSAGAALVSSPADVASAVVSGTSRRRDLALRAERLLDRLLPSLSPSEALAALAPLSGSPTRPAPEWLRRVTGALSSRTLMRTGGVVALATAMLGAAERGAGVDGADGGEEQDESAKVDWKATERVAKLVSAVPRVVASVEEYYAAICPQVVAVLRDAAADIKGRRPSPALVATMVRLVSSLFARNAALAERLLLSPLLANLSVAATLVGVGKETDGCEDATALLRGASLGGGSSRVVVVGESELSAAVQSLHRIVAMAGAGPALVAACVEHVPVLFRLHLHCRGAPTALRSPVHEALVALLRLAEVSQAVDALYRAVFPRTRTSQHAPSYAFASGPSGGVVLQSVDATDGGSASDDEWLAACVVELIVTVASDTLSCAVFLRLLADYSDASGCGTTGSEPAGCGTERSRTVLLHVVLALAESLGPALLKDASHVIAFVAAVLNAAVAAVDAEEGEEGEGRSEHVPRVLRGIATHASSAVDEDRAETVSVALALLAVLVEDESRLTDAQSTQLLALLPLLDTISRSQSQPSAGEVHSGSNRLDVPPVPLRGLSEDVVLLARDLRDKVAIHKAVAARKRAQQATAQPGAKSPASQHSETFAHVMDMLKDPLLPVRAHGLMGLRRLVLRGDAEARANTATAMALFENALEDPDSYMYLTAINGLAAMADVMPRRAIPHLAREFSDKQRAPDTRLRIGEALLLAAERLGEALPRHAGEFLAAFFAGARDEDALVRASSLSNIGTIAGNLRYAIHPFVVEILSCAEAVARYDRDAMARRAAVHVILLLVRGMGHDALEAVPEHLKGMYRLLKEIARKDADDVARSHANAALQSLDEVFRAFLFPSRG